MTAAALLAAVAPSSVAAMQHHRRVLIIAAPGADDARLAVQRQALAADRSALADRDVSVVTVIGDTVEGASDLAPALRRHWGLPAAAFTVVLVGKDGHTALRSDAAQHARPRRHHRRHANAPRGAAVSNGWTNADARLMCIGSGVDTHADEYRDR